jgi:Ca-activated chloride channel family protein
VLADEITGGALRRDRTGLSLGAAALPAPWLVWRCVPPHRDRTPALRFPFFRRIAEAAGAEPRPGSVVLRRLRVQMLAAMVVWALVVVALARPERVGDPVEIEKAARDVVLAVDISGSMDTRDFEGADSSRLQRPDAVKRVVGRFVEARQGDRVALIVFGAKAFVQAPFTEDLRTVRALLDETEVGMAGPHTVLGDAIGLAIRTFEASEIERRLVILLSDGADTGSRMSPINAAEIAVQDGVTIFTVGVGDPDASGEDRVDLQALRDVAARAGGQFFFADDEAGLAEVYARIDAMAPREVETLSDHPRLPLAHLPLGIAALIALATTGWLHFRGTLRSAV